MSHFVKHWFIYTLVLVCILFGLVVFRLLFVNHFDQHEQGYFFDKRTGVLTLADRRGYHITNILVSGYTIDLRPHQVCINANSRVLNCKLVKFDRDGFGDFIAKHGVANYTYSSSTTSSGTNDLGGILKSYAYEGSGRLYPFLDIVTELVPNNSAMEEELFENNN